MAKKYLKVSPNPGQFYASEGWKPGNTGPDGYELSQHQHDSQLAQMLLAGPFETRNEAESWNTSNANGHAAIWQQ